MMPAARPLIDRFWEKVAKSDGCWEWVAGRNKKGYGTINDSGIPRLAHRISWRFHFGEAPPGLCVLHRCDNPACVRPDHLFLGTIADNNADMVRKGRASGGRHPGELAPCSKLTAEQVIEMRSTYAVGQAPAAARKYGIRPQSAWRILTRQSWRHL